MTVLAAPVTVNVDAFDGNVAVWSDFESHTGQDVRRGADDRDVEPRVSTDRHLRPATDVAGLRLLERTAWFIACKPAMLYIPF